MKDPGASSSVLLVDDREQNLLALEAVLEPLHLRLVRASCGEEALSAVLREDLALILMDVAMPGMDGFETAAEIKRRAKSSQIPIIFLTAAQSERPTISRAYEVGAVDYLAKPFSPAVIRSKVQVFVELHAARRDAERQARRAAHDPLTGLPSRMLFMDRLESALAAMWRRPTRLAVLFFDLDGFKLVNDTLGHEAGDDLLQQAAERLIGLLRPSDSAARFGGDEFIVLAEIREERDVDEITERISLAVAAPFRLEAGDAFVSASIGVALASSPHIAPETLVREADAAMYRAKQSGGGRCEIYDAHMRRRARERVETEAGLRQALERGELELAYQPEVDVPTGAVVAVEALLRWEHPERGLLRPPKFLPGVEHSPLMSEIGAWVLEEALGQLERWDAAMLGGEPVTLAVNVSARELGGRGFAAAVASALAAREAGPSRLRLEISESAVLDQLRFPIATLDELRAHGIGLALDDFGGGCASLARMRDLPLDMVKIDRSLVEAAGAGDESSSLLAAMVKLAHALGFTAVAEAVETAADAQEMLVLGCHRAQGDYFAPPMRPDAVADLLSSGAALPRGPSAWVAQPSRGEVA